jgi:hypothetical protein
MQSCKTSEGDSSSLQVCNSGVGPIARDPYPTRSTWICTTGPWGISIEGLLYCQQRNDFVGIGDGSGAREERATATQKSHQTLQLPIPLQQTHVFFFFFFCFSTSPNHASC